MQRLLNINGTEDNPCSCGSWLNHWVNFSGQEIPYQCPVAGCDNITLIGAHVQKNDPSDNAWYIIPLCLTHNAYTDFLLIDWPGIRLVPANVWETCKKRIH
jgi:hypothetical protein